MPFKKTLEVEEQRHKLKLIYRAKVREQKPQPYHKNNPEKNRLAQRRFRQRQKAKKEVCPLEHS